jgi:Kdo2-lipid IVA lauroyltransferase/acyltransferase
VKRRSDLPAYLAMRAALALVRVAPRAPALAAGGALGGLARSFGLRTAVTEANLARAFPEQSVAERRRLVRAVYRHFGRATVDSLIIGSKGPASLVPFVDGGEATRLIEERLPRGKGIIIATGHVGNWELAGAYLAARGYPLAAVVKAPSNRYVAAHAERTRRALGIETILMHEALARVPEALRAGKLVALVADQGAIRSDVWARFFGVPTQTPVGPGLFAARTGAPVLFGALVSAPGGRYQLLGEVLEDAPENDPGAMAQRLAPRYWARLEAVVRAVPEQYLWTHRLWKRQPPPHAGAPAAR